MTKNNLNSVIIHFDSGDRRLNNVHSVDTSKQQLNIGGQVYAVSNDLSGITIYYSDGRSEYIAKNRF